MTSKSPAFWIGGSGSRQHSLSIAFAVTTKQRFTMSSWQDAKKNALLAPPHLTLPLLPPVTPGCPPHSCQSIPKLHNISPTSLFCILWTTNSLSFPLLLRAQRWIFILSQKKKINWHVSFFYFNSNLKCLKCETTLQVYLWRIHQ